MTSCYYSTPEYCDQFVCLSVCVYACLSVREHISGIAGRNLLCNVQILCGRDSVLLWQRCDTLCTSGFMDDVTFGRNGSCGASGVAISGRSLISMNALLCITPIGRKKHSTRTTNTTTQKTAETRNKRQEAKHHIISIV